MTMMYVQLAIVLTLIITVALIDWLNERTHQTILDDINEGDN